MNAEQFREKLINDTGTRFASAYGPKMEVKLDFDPEEMPSLTKQSMRDETDINLIVRKYKKTGHLTHINESVARFMDLPDIGYQDALNAVIEAQDAFMDLPSELRKKFGNDPANFLDFVNDEKNIGEMEELGLLDIKKEEPIELVITESIEEKPEDNVSSS